MQKSLQKSGDFACRHELDRLATTAVVAAQPAAFEQLAELAAIAKKEIPGVNASQNGLIQALRDDPESIYAFQYNGSVLGGIAFLYLNCRGHDALLLDEIDLKNPSRNHLARPGEDVSAIYVWALAAHGRAAIALGNVAQRLRRPRFADADYFAQPSSAAGRDLLIALGFAPIASFQPNLWTYQRPWKRAPSIVPPVNVSVPVRSPADVC